MPTTQHKTPVDPYRLRLGSLAGAQHTACATRLAGSGDFEGVAFHAALATLAFLWATGVELPDRELAFVFGSCPPKCKDECGREPALLARIGALESALRATPGSRGHGLPE